MDVQLFIACLALAAFVGVVAGYVVREVEGFGPRSADDTEHGAWPL